jgi:AcrR family transcriptional regulator
MSMSSTSASPPRREPKQARACLRRAKFLEVAARLFGELGYDAVTMTAIAEHAQASIGTLYDYFPDKQDLALVLKTKYMEESDGYWATLLDGQSSLAKTALADLFIEGALVLGKEKPGFLALMTAPIAYARSGEARQPLRRAIAGALQRINPKLPSDRALINAHIVAEMIKGLLSAYQHALPKERGEIVKEFKKLMRLYLIEALR